MENPLPELSPAEADDFSAAEPVLTAVRLLSVALTRRELRFEVAASPHRWQEQPGGRMPLHTYSDEWFFQLRGGCTFEFPGGRALHLTNGGVLLVPRGVPHAEYATDASDGKFANLVMVVGEDCATVHVATASAADHTLPEVYKEVKLGNVEFYRGLTIAAAGELTAGTAERLLECLLFQLERDVSATADEDAPTARHYLAVRARKLVEACPVNRWYTVGSLAEKLNCSPNYLSTLFRRNYGTTLKEFLLKRRLENARIMLLDGTLNASEAAARCGFEDAAYFARIFRRRFGHTPAQLRKTVPR